MHVFLLKVLLMTADIVFVLIAVFLEVNNNSHILTFSTKNQHCYSSYICLLLRMRFLGLFGSFLVLFLDIAGTTMML